jgi:hypothetical protein
MPAVIAVVADMRLTHLQHISFLPSAFHIYSPLVATRCTAGLAVLVGLPSVKTVLLAGPFSPAIFRSPSPNLLCVRFLNSVSFDTPNQSRPQYASRVEIEQIYITTSFRVLGPFLGSQSSLDFSKLTDVTVSRSASRELVIVLQSAKSTIQRLTCDACMSLRYPRVSTYQLTPLRARPADLTVFDLNGFSALSDLRARPANFYPPFPPSHSSGRRM